MRGIHYIFPDVLVKFIKDVFEMFSSSFLSVIINLAGRCGYTSDLKHARLQILLKYLDFIMNKYETSCFFSTKTVGATVKVLRVNKHTTNISRAEAVEIIKCYPITFSLTSYLFQYGRYSLTFQRYRLKSLLSQC